MEGVLPADLLAVASDISSDEVESDESSDSSDAESPQDKPTNEKTADQVRSERWKKFSQIDSERVAVVKKMKRRRGGRRHRKRQKTATPHSDAQSYNSVPPPTCEPKPDPLQPLKPYMDLPKPPQSSGATPVPKSGLEEKIEQAIADGKIGEAEELNEKLAEREMAVRITEAVRAREWKEDKDVDVKKRGHKKKKQLGWMFEAKQRWETKGNM
ncbi:PREDICTED: protein FAM204A-like [Branchiostoma belcheri]|uniref:Protein FAM204A-like n=1 Tax=Branchiostoma belcheri TaxID=7741 RepID=A0A6P4YVZ2_BRABE|nr:PREDICTED: protein FAM204A-like [Branchiostoma belcheri]